MQKDEKYYIDKNNNKWSIIKYTQEEAEQASASLDECSDCTDCENCVRCVECRSLTNSSDCAKVSFSRNCRNCTGLMFAQDCVYCHSSSHINDLKYASGVDGKKISSEKVRTCMNIVEKLLITDDAAVFWRDGEVWININGTEGRSKDFDGDVIAQESYDDIYSIIMALGEMTDENFKKARKIVREACGSPAVKEAFRLLGKRNRDLARSLAEMENLYLESQSRLKEYQNTDRLQNVIESNTESLRELSARIGQ